MEIKKLIKEELSKIDNKTMDIAEFRKLGYVQEINRRFLHPLGLALQIKIGDESGKEEIGGILDYRNDPEGIYYDIKNSENDRIEKFKKNRDFIDSELNKFATERKDKLGFDIEPID